MNTISTGRQNSLNSTLRSCLSVSTDSTRAFLSADVKQTRTRKCTVANPQINASIPQRSANSNIETIVESDTTEPARNPGAKLPITDSPARIRPANPEQAIENSKIRIKR